VICALWDGPDEPTRLLFTGFYARVLAGAARGPAFHETVRELAGKYPGWTVAWGGFVLYGRTDVLARFSVRGLRFASMKWPKSAPSNRARAEALYNRGNIHLFASEWAEAVAAYTEFLALPELSPRHVAMVLVNRSGAYRGAGDVTHMLEDLSAVIEGSATPADQRAKALILRSEHSLNEGNLAAALADADAVIEGVGAPPEELAGAHLLRGLAHEREGNAEQAHRCYLAAREVEGAPPARVELANTLIARLGREP
jgi:tetratricopeptide (TPR) repeat protein